MSELTVCARCEVSAPCPCGGIGPHAPSRLVQWFDLTVWTLPVFVTALDDVDAAEPTYGDIIEVRGHRLGRMGGAPFIVLAKLADGRWCYGSFALRDADDMAWTVVVAASLDTLWWHACTDEDRERFTPQLAQAALDEELVRIDQLLESEDPAMRALAEGRALQRGVAWPHRRG